MLKKSLFWLLLLTAPAIAQQTPPPEVQACQSMLLEQVQRQLDVRSQAFTLAAENARLQARIKELESKEEKK